jgi:uncharacterized protein YqjF (DUF2071 family)
MLHYEVDPRVLSPFVPAGTELDTWKDRHFVTVVGFEFRNTRMRGFRVPFHVNFEEVNLRFYVRRRIGPEWRRGVVFVRELVPRFAIAATARLLYNEKYSFARMGHQWSRRSTGSDSLTYWWVLRGQRGEISVAALGDAEPIAIETDRGFFTEHYWGYTSQRNGTTLEYRVEHPRWLARSVTDSRFDADVSSVYGPSFEPFLRNPPSSAFLAEGSEVAVYVGSRLGGSTK